MIGCHYRLPHHQKLLERSAIRAAVADFRGYRSVVKKTGRNLGLEPDEVFEEREVMVRV